MLPYDVGRAEATCRCEDRLLVLAPLDQALCLETLEHLTRRRARDAEHLGDPRCEHGGVGRGAVLADREGEEVDRFQVFVDRMRPGHRPEPTPAGPGQTAVIAFGFS